MAGTGFRASVLYEFVGQGDHELTVNSGEEVTVVSQEVGEGWWKAKNRRGKEGLIPSSYVEVINLPEPSMPPPPPPKVRMSQPPEDVYYNDLDEVTKPPIIRPPLLRRETTEDDWENEDDWSDSEINMSRSAPAAGSEFMSSNGARSEDTGSVRSQGEKSYSENAKFSTIRKGFGKSFAKSGGEEFLLALERSPKVVAMEAVVTDSSNGPAWKETSAGYQCAVDEPRKESKMKGMKSFIAYQLTPSFNGIQVSRRYKQFDWLHKRLSEKFLCVCIPPLPEKQVTGRFEEDFVQTRRRLLQLWLDRMISHPVISRSQVMLHFVSCTTNDKQWKSGKRDAEKDPLQGGKFFFAVETPTQTLDWPSINDRADRLENFVSEMEKSNKNLTETVQLFNRKQAGPMHKEFIKMSDAFTTLSSALALDPDERSKNLRDAICHTGQAYQTIGFMYSQQPRKDGEIMIESLQEYTGILSTMPSLLQLQRGAINTVAESNRSLKDEKMRPEEVTTIKEHANVIAYAVTAETNLLRDRRDADFKAMMRAYLAEQINFYKQITMKLEESAAMFNQ